MLLTRSLQKSNRGIKVLTMNTLADLCSNNEETGFPHVNPEYLTWNYRKHLLLQELLAYDPHFICLQEVDKFHEWYQPELRKHGYDGIFKGKSTLNELQRNATRTGVFGCAIFWKTNNWVMNTFTEFYLPHTGQGCIIVTCKHTSGFTLNVGTTHLKAKKPFSAERVSQVETVLAVIGDHQDISIKGPIVFAGDFNAEPTEECIAKMIENGFVSAYQDLESNPDHYTTIKTRADTVKHVIDYIFYRDLVLTDRLNVPSSDTLEWPYLPCATYPSDHFSLMAVFEVEGLDMEEIRQPLIPITLGGAEAEAEAEIPRLNYVPPREKHVKIQEDKEKCLQEELELMYA